MAQATASPPLVFSTGHYRLVDGVRRTGKLCLVSDNELQVKQNDSTAAQAFAAVQVKNFVIGADSFTVLRNFDLVVNESVTHYPHGMVKICFPGSGLEMYQFQGPMDVYQLPKQMDPVARNILRGLSGGAVGVATGMLIDKASRPPEGHFEEQTMTVYLLKHATAAPQLTTLQPGTRRAKELIEVIVSDNTDLRKKVHRLYNSSLTSEKILEILTQYLSGKSR